MRNGLAFPWSLLSFILFLVPLVLAEPASLPFLDCFDASANASQKISVSTIYAQVSTNNVWGTYLNLTVIGESPQQILGIASSSLATLFTSTSVLTLNSWTNSSYLCAPLRPPSPLPTLNTSTIDYCPIAAGPIAFSSTIPWGKNRALTTLSTRLRAVDPFGSELVCVDVLTTPLSPKSHDPYGNANAIFWSTIALTIAYWVVIGIARIVSAWGRGISRRGVWARAQSAGFILASAVSGERLAASPALMRFGTPSMRDILFHTQWCAVLAMVAVEWPQFAYPLLTQTAWAALAYNVTLVASHEGHRWNPLSTAPYSPPANFADQLADPSSPLFIDTNIPNILFTLPSNASNGISSFAYTIGIYPQDLFANCLILFLGIIGCVIVVSLLVWFLDSMVTLIGGKVSNNNGFSRSGHSGLSSAVRARSPTFSNTRDLLLAESPLTANAQSVEESKSLTGHAQSLSGLSRFGLPLGGGTNGAGDRAISTHRAWWRFRSDISSFHFSVLHGNLVRVLVLFHLPITVFSCYQMTLPHSEASTSSIALAALSFIFLSLLIPAHLVLRVHFTSTSKLYDETRTLLSYGPLYNHYRHGSQMFAALFFVTSIAFGVTVGAGQKSGTAQAIIILVIEVISALVTSVWLPWGSGASMGLISFLFCVARIVVAVLLVILTPTISIGVGPGGWVAYGILIILALVYLALTLMLLVKIVEAVVRIIGGIGFDRSRHVVDSGLLGACGLLGCCGPRKRRRPRARKEQYNVAPLQPATPGVESDMSSYTSPLQNNGSGMLPRFQGGTDSRKGSINSQPPSVLRPEHANRPYKEDNDDDGFIMGAWQPSRSEYPPVNAYQNNLPKAGTSNSGFSRIGGGRAHIDTPYAIAPGSVQTFPSLGQQGSAALASPVFIDDDDPTPSLSNVARQPEIGTLPPGAMPAHVRTKSQTAIIEDAGGSYAPVRPQHESNSSSGNATLLMPPPKFSLGAGGDEDDEDNNSEEQPKKKPWFQFRRNRTQSSGEPSTNTTVDPPVPPVDEELGGLGNPPLTAPPGRSFVVIRKPPGSVGRMNQATTSTHPGARPPTR